ncbi:MAG: hypothetical protein H6624_15620 [Bdellovibrionaceae bacterium]|nr:hypothetical protein [Pseudobdellovibrionaceae bacterium]
MNKNKTVRRIAVSEAIFCQLETEVNRIKSSGTHFKVNESKLAAVIIKRFFKIYLEKDRSLLEKEFFDKKSYLEQLLKQSNSDEELQQSLGQFLRNSKGRRGRKTNKKKENDSSDSLKSEL